MSSHRRTSGRPSIGQPEMVWGRVSTDLRNKIEDLARDYQVSKSRVVAALLEVGLANLDQLPLTAKPTEQGELPLKAS